MADHMQGEGEPEGPWVGGWLLSALAGLIAAIMARFVGDVGFGAVLLVALLVFGVFGVLLGLFWGSRGAEHDDHAQHPAPVAHAAPMTPVAPVAAAEPVAAAMPLATLPEVAPAEPLAPLPVAEPVALSEPLPPAEPLDAAEPLTPAEPLAAAEPLAPVETIATLAEEEPLEPFPVLEPVPPVPPLTPVPVEGGGQKPPGLPEPRGGKADDLQTLEGIGPVLEKLCHDLGIFHFDQIAAWGPEEVAWMDGNLKGFRGRVTRDKWVAQAKLIGAVGVEAFLIRAKTNDY
jgi:predicted flap endonuclease-1-like 5' DNA nuclease